jgi:hypothetical protein
MTETVCHRVRMLVVSDIHGALKRVADVGDWIRRRDIRCTCHVFGGVFLAACAESNLSGSPAMERQPTADRLLWPVSEVVCLRTSACYG